MKLEYKLMEEKDFESCAYELIEAFKEEPWNEEWTFEQAFTRIDEIMSSRVSRGYVIYDGDVVAAMACGRIMTYIDFKELWIDEFSVNPLYHRKGIGSKMMEFIRSELKKEKIKISYLALNTESDYPCVSFYKNNGFRISETNVAMFANVDYKGED
ncbi:GNAT family N-acetyltransferase [Clostridium sp. D53t1_180928_C8]|uniref:GNAT family N-acetyltransferase n=1 Tax=Clostridium sp. D53t1_180928_C8 TaxID=2787101 RepID=UPI0018A99EA2|nr:GNAT family N-acetyltransferase [Clostridium sp. D53t1_180928_C8]